MHSLPDPSLLSRVVFTPKLIKRSPFVVRIAGILRCRTRGRGCEQIWISQQWGLHAWYWNMKREWNQQFWLVSTWSNINLQRFENNNRQISCHYRLQSCKLMIIGIFRANVWRNVKWSCHAKSSPIEKWSPQTTFGCQNWSPLPNTVPLFNMMVFVS